MKKILGRLGRTVLSIAFRIAGWLIPKKTRKAVFLSFPDASDNSWHLYAHLCKQLRGYSFVWLCASPSKVECRVRLECNRYGFNRVTALRRLSLPGLYHFLSAKNIFYSHGTYVFATAVRGQKFVRLGHGMPIKAVGYLNKANVLEVPYCDFALSTSVRLQSLIATAYALPTQNVLPFGLPRNDRLRYADPDVEQRLFRALRLSPQTKLLMWMPTFRMTTGTRLGDDSVLAGFIDEWKPGFLDELNSVARSAGCHILVKLHPKDRMNHDKRSYAMSCVSVLTSSQWDQLGVDLYAALACSSALISDFSSVLVDYIVTGKPLAVTVGSKANYLRDTTMLEGELDRSCFRIDSETTFKRFVQKLPVASNRDSLDSLNPPQATQACERITEYFEL